MKVLVTGSSGILGNKLVSHLISRGYYVYASIHNKPLSILHGRLKFRRVDLSMDGELERFIDDVEPDVVIHAAAYTDVDGCEKAKNYAWKVNVESIYEVIRASRKYKARVIYISTDYVFDGEKGNYTEEDIPNPLSYYGLTKLVGESIILSYEYGGLVIRPSAIYGFGGRANFATYVIEKLSKGEPVNALIDQIVSPTYNALLAEAIVEMMEKDITGLYHVAGHPHSRYEFALKIAKFFGLPKELVKPVKMDSMTNWIAKRPKNSSLNCSKAYDILELKYFDVDYALVKLYKEYKEMVEG